MSRIDQPRNQRSQDTRAAILDAAWRLLEERGGQGLTMSAVADAAGVSRAGLYLHFSSRGQLFTGLLDHIDERLDLQASLRPVLEAPDAVQALDAWAHHTASYHSRLLPVARAIDRARHDDADARELWGRAMQAWHDACTRLTNALADEHRLADPWTPATAADLLWAFMSVELVDDLVIERGWEVDDLADRLFLLVRRTLVTDPPAEAATG